MWLLSELIESTVYVYQATGDPQMLHIGASILEAIDSIAKTECGYAVVHDVTTHQLANRMESFFLAETTKYLYLLFDKDNFIHNSGGHGSVINTHKGQCVIDAGGYVFNTEAHPIDMAVLDCCYDSPREQYSQVFNDIDILNAFDLAGSRDERFYSTENINKMDNELLSEVEKAIEAESMAADDENYIPAETPIEKKRKREKLLTCSVEPFYLKLAIYGETIVK